MKISFPRHIVYTVLFTVTMIIAAIWFAADALIPMGKEYRKNRLTLKKEKADLQRYETFYKKTLDIYNQTKSKHRHITEAFSNKFDPESFKKEYARYFIDFTLTKLPQRQQYDWYEVYEVNTTSKIKSPKNFYDFLEALNKSRWIVGVTFPIDFSREGELIHSSFKIQVYKKTADAIPQKKVVKETRK